MIDLGIGLLIGFVIGFLVAGMFRMGQGLEEQYDIRPITKIGEES